ncbi:MAG: hypothetical protein GY846_11710, partial [Deltaproteobacteria bacterium]|nr:hypothetical protein [Deltaproteobacteria bacterium]
IHKDDITLNLVQLYKAAHELAPGDLRRQLRKFGYKKTAPPEPPENTISIMGMAHKKWGIIYGNRVKPRVSAADLDLQIQELFKWVRNLDTELLNVTLSLNGYHPVSEKLIYTAVKPEIAGAFLESKQIEKNAGQTISWESAGKYIGKRVTVQGTIIRSYNSGKACFLNFHGNFTRYMSLTIFETALRKFPFRPEKYYLNKTVRVRGKIKRYKGRPEIIVESPKQIEVVKSY